MVKSFTVTELIPASPDKIYNAWLDSEGHSRMTGSPARASDQVGGTFEAWDGYISGRNLELEPGKHILQAWRTTEFAASDEDSVLDVTFEAAEGGTKVTIRHSHLPEDGDQYLQGWIDFYFQPMKAYFGS
jgi:activator of HSP90 ATPase